MDVGRYLLVISSSWNFLSSPEPNYKGSMPSQAGALQLSSWNQAAFVDQYIFFFLTFPACFSNPMIFSNLNSNCSNLLDLRNLQEQVKKAFCYQKLSWPFTVWINCSSDLKNFENSQLSASNFKSFSRSLEHFFLTVGRTNFGNKIPLISCKFIIV